jgi:hypothetical protein
MSDELTRAERAQTAHAATVRSLIAQQSEITARLGADVGDALTQLDKFQSHQRSQLTAYQSEQSARLSEQEERLNAEIDRIQRTVSHADKDLASVDEEQASIEQGIYDRTKDSQEEKKALLAAKEDIEARIAELMRQVRAPQL